MTTESKKKNRNLIVLIVVVIGLCATCFIVTSLTMGEAPTPQVQSTNPPPVNEASIPSSDPAAEFANKYLNEYGGVYESYTEIYYMTDCKELQAQFEIAYANNQRETAGTPLFKVTLGYMTAIDDHMRAIGCY